MTSIEITNKCKKLKEAILHNRFLESELKLLISNIFNKKIEFYYDNVYSSTDTILVFEMLGDSIKIHFIIDKLTKFYVTQIETDFL